MSESSVAQPELLPWEPRKGESGPAFAAFAAYRDLGPQRSIQKAAQNQSKATPTLKAWSRKHHWVDRAAAYDTYIDRRRREMDEEEWRIANSRHRAIGAHMTSAVLRRLAGHKATKVAALDPNEMNWRDVRSLAQSAIAIDRVVHGQPTDFALRVTTMSINDALQHVRMLVDLARRHMDTEQFQAFISDYAAYTGARLELPPNPARFDGKKQ